MENASGPDLFSGATSMATCAPTADLFTVASLAEADLATFRLQCATDMAAYDGRLQQQQQLQLSSRRGTSIQLASHTSIGVYSQPLECLRPTSGSWMRRHEPLKLPLTIGRVCAHDLCQDNCALHVRDEVVMPAEAESLVAHGQRVLDAEDLASHQPVGDLTYLRSRRVDFLESATHGAIAGHLLCLRIAERLRRIAAETFGLPRSRVRVAEHFLTLRQPGPTLEQAVHCDEAVFPHGAGARGRWRFHFSSVLWLGESGSDFDGGALAFYHNQTRPWLEVESRIGRAAFFSSGWENIHGIKSVSRGRRWAFTAAFMVHEQAGAQPNCGHDFFEHCVRPSSKLSYDTCRQQWAASLQ